MAFKRKYKFSIIDHLYYAGRIRRIHNRWSMPLDAIFLWVFAVVPSLLIIRFLYWVIPLWLPSALSVGLVWAAVEVYSLILNNNKHSLNLVYVEPYTKFSNTIY